MRRAGWALVAVAMLLPAACGRSEGEEFREDRLRPLEQRLARERARVAATLRVVRPGNRRDARALREDVGAVAATVRELGGLVPPPGVREEYDGYLAALRDLVAALRSFPAAVQRGDGGALDAVSVQVQEATGRVQQRAEQLERRLLAV